MTESALSYRGYTLKTDAAGGVESSFYLNGGTSYIQSANKAQGHLIVAGSTMGGLRLLNPLQAKFGGGFNDGFVASFNEDGELEWSTLLGGSGSETISAVVPLPDGSVEPVDGQSTGQKVCDDKRGFRVASVA